MDREKIIINDFNKLALANIDDTLWNHNRHYYKYILNKIPYPCEVILEIGCGNGELCRLMAGKSRNIFGVDLSEKMIENAEKMSSEKNIKFINADILTCLFEPNSFDYIVSVATFHHLPYSEILEKSKQWLKEGGTLLILDIYKEKTILDYLVSLVAIPSNIFMNFSKNKVLRKKEDQAMKEHIKHDVYMPLKDIHEIVDSILPNAIIRRHLFWRYSLIWKKEV